MSDLGFKYCPFCGGQMPQADLVKFCPFCGVSLFQVQSVATKVIQKIQTEPEEVILQEYNDKNENGSMEYKINQNYKRTIRSIGEDEYYSIILKGASTKQKLVQRLEEVLLRGSFAIRLAVDNIPNIIVYKSRKEDISFFSRVFFEEQASISIIPGDFNDQIIIEELFTNFKTLHFQVQNMIKAVPLHLWLGDRILSVFPNTYKDDKEGVMIISDQNVFFMYKNKVSLEDAWFVRSYSLLLKVVVDQKNLELTDRNSKVHCITFQEKGQVLNAYECIKKATVQSQLL